jgi:hypothetical protein
VEETKKKESDFTQAERCLDKEITNRNRVIGGILDTYIVQIFIWWMSKDAKVTLIMLNH